MNEYRLQPLNLLPKTLKLSAPQMISLVGAGGKTSLLFALGQVLAAQGAKVVVTTTTHIAQPAAGQVQQLLLNPQRSQVRQMLARSGLYACGCPTFDHKLTAPAPPFFDYIMEYADYLLIEADGAKHLPLKAPAAHEPMIIPATNLVIGLIGLSALGQRVDQCFRWQELCQISGYQPQDLVDEALLVQLAKSPQGLRKGVGEQMRLILLLNQADNAAQIAAGQRVKQLGGNTAIAKVIIASLQQGYFID